MKSFLELVACCVTTAEASAEEGVATAAAASRMEAAPVRNKKRVTRVGTWKPSLHVISEDYVEAKKTEKAQPEPPPPTAGWVAERKSSRSSRSKLHLRSYSNDVGRNPVQVAIPTFSPTPFMF